MGQKTEKRVIGGLEFTTTQLPAMKALALSARIGRAVGPALAEASGLSGSMEVARLAPAISALFAKLDGTEAQGLAREILASTSVVYEGKLIQLGDNGMIDHVFTGSLGDLFAAIRFAVEVNFADFFAALTSVVNAPALVAEVPKANG